MLRADPDTDTVRALTELGALEAIAGSPDADRITAEVLILGQDLDVGPGQLGELLLIRGIYLTSVERRPEAVAYFRESARVAERADAIYTLGRALLNLSDVLSATDPAAAAEAARTAIGHLSRIGNRKALSVAIMNLAESLLQLGDWDTAEAELVQVVESDAPVEAELPTSAQGWLTALRGDAGSAETMLAALPDMRASEDPQDKTLVGLAEALTAAARGQWADALHQAQAVLTHAGALGISAAPLRWAWPLAARSAHELRDTAAVRDLLALLDGYRPGHLAPMLRAERDLARARLSERDGGQPAAAAFAAAIAGLREKSTPYHLAHGLLDHAEYLNRHGDPDAAALAVDEARDIGRRLRCQPLLDRADAIEGVTPKVQA